MKINHLFIVWRLKWRLRWWLLELLASLLYWSHKLLRYYYVTIFVIFTRTWRTSWAIAPHWIRLNFDSFKLFASIRYYQPCNSRLRKIRLIDDFTQEAFWKQTSALFHCSFFFDVSFVFVMVKFSSENEPNRYEIK